MSGGVSATTIAAVVSATAAVGSLAMSAFAGGKTPKIPDPAIPAAPASGARADTGASVKLGTSIKDQRVSGTRTSSGAKGGSVDILGSLGGGGLSV